MDDVDLDNLQGLVAKYGRLKVGNGTSGSEEGTVVVRGEWVDACVKAQRLLGEAEGYDGWEVR